MSPPPNQRPEIQFIGLPRAVERSTPQETQRVMLRVDVSDADEDPVSVYWSVTRDGVPSGVLKASQQGQASIEWQTPLETTQDGSDLIRVVAKDGKDSTVVTETIQVGTLKDSRIAFLSETWAAQDSPFIVAPTEADLVIDEGTTLTVEAGSELLMAVKDTPMGISVVGTLDIDGTADKPVTIRPNARVAEPGDWRGITASPSGVPPHVNLDHAYLMYAADAVKANTRGFIRLNGCRISLSRDSAVLHFSEDELRVENSEITGNLKSGIKVSKIAEPMPSSIVITGNRIMGNGDTSGATIYVSEAGIYIDIPDRMGASAITIAGNEIRNNGVPGIQLAQCCFPLVNDNAIYANELGKSGARYNIKLEEDFGVGGDRDVIDATTNYWGGAYDPVSGESLIKDMIRDSEDDATVQVRVLVVPWDNDWP